MTAKLQPCKICGKLTPRKTCSRSHEFQHWRNEHPLEYVASREKQNAKRRAERASERLLSPIPAKIMPCAVETPEKPLFLEIEAIQQEPETFNPDFGDPSISAWVDAVVCRYFGAE